jgi:ribosomal protein S7
MSLRISLEKLNKLGKGRRNTFPSSFTGLLLKNGGKGKASRMCENVFTYSSTRLKKPFPLVVRRLMSKLAVPFEIKTETRGKRQYQAPYFAKRRRHRYLAMKTIIKDVRNDKVLNNLTTRLSYEVARVLTDMPSNTVEKLNTLRKDVITHKAYLHFRW